MGVMLLGLTVSGIGALVLHVALCVVLYLGLCLMTGVYGKEQWTDLGRMLGI